MDLTGEEHMASKYIHPILWLLLMRYNCLISEHEVYSPYLVVFLLFDSLLIIMFLQDETNWKSYNVARASMMDVNYSLPDNVAIVTLQVL